MPEPVAATVPVPTATAQSTGFCGKVPARGDFINIGLPRRFVEPWHDWMQRVLAASRLALGKDWEAAWNEAPIWRFALSPDICGPDAVLGLWMPSIDSVGRQFPLTFATAGVDVDELIRDAARFLAAAEAAGLAALERDLTPDEIAALVASEAPTEASPVPERSFWDGAIWWTDGAPLVPAGSFATGALPDETLFAAMLQADGMALPPSVLGDVE